MGAFLDTAYSFFYQFSLLLHVLYQSSVLMFCEKYLIDTFTSIIISLFHLLMLKLQPKFHLESRLLGLRSCLRKAIAKLILLKLILILLAGNTFRQFLFDYVHERPCLAMTIAYKLQFVCSALLKLLGAFSALISVLAGFTLNFLKNLVEIQFYACNIVSVRSLCNAVNDMCCVNSSNGLKGQSNKRPITMDEVKQNKKEGSMCTVLKGCVYNLSPYMKFRPGGVDMLMKAVGKDSTSLFSIPFLEVYLSSLFHRNDNIILSMFSQDLVFIPSGGFIVAFSLQMIQS
ncbi:hypothetical protein Patl1_17162 [Pistacia atlantica]|uniref:Uncharacterized protein n=1 Tax=Pistacia atlantica TaxID=434234 RepID=A0ACC1BAK6_9ROSI|nr:hypothetical protein Patl1_17162 [Pistacia atlantica]